MQDVFCSAIKRLGQQNPKIRDCFLLLLSVLFYAAFKFKSSISTKADTRINKVFDDVFFHIEKDWIEKQICQVFGGPSKSQKYFRQWATTELEVCLHVCSAILTISACTESCGSQLYMSISVYLSDASKAMTYNHAATLITMLYVCVPLPAYSEKVIIIRMYWYCYPNNYAATPIVKSLYPYNQVLTTMLLPATPTNKSLLLTNYYCMLHYQLCCYIYNQTRLSTSHSMSIIAMSRVQAKSIVSLTYISSYLQPTWA